MFYTVDKSSNGKRQRIKELKRKSKSSKFKQVLKDPKAISSLDILQEQYVMCLIDKAANNIAFICKKYVQVLLKELASLTIKKWMILFIMFISNKIIFLILFLDWKNDDEEFNCLPCIYWLPKWVKYHLMQNAVKRWLVRNLSISN